MLIPSVAEAPSRMMVISIKTASRGILATASQSMVGNKLLSASSEAFLRQHSENALKPGE